MYLAAFFFVKDYPFSFQTLNSFSNSDPYHGVAEQYRDLQKQLDSLKVKYNFPAVNNNIGLFFKFMAGITSPKLIFEMGSGYGHSAFWFLLGAAPQLDKIILTEMRTDLNEVFEQLPWPAQWKQKIHYYQEDAFEVIKQFEDIDMLLIDGVKANYLKFLEHAKSHLKTGALVFIDNSYWRGSFLDPELVANKSSARHIKDLHEFIDGNEDWEAVFIPYQDGLTLLRKL